MRIGKEAEDSTWDDPTSDDSTSEAVGVAFTFALPAMPLVAKVTPLQAALLCRRGWMQLVHPVISNPTCWIDWDLRHQSQQASLVGKALTAMEYGLCKNVYISSRKCGIPIAILDWSAAWFWRKFPYCKRTRQRLGVAFAFPCLSLGQVAAPNCVEPRGWFSFDLKCQECQDIGSWTEYKSKSLHEIKSIKSIVLQPNNLRPMPFRIIEKHLVHCPGKIETTPFEVRAPSPPRGLETPIGPAEDAGLGGHGYPQIVPAMPTIYGNHHVCDGESIATMWHQWPKNWLSHSWWFEWIHFGPHSLKKQKTTGLTNLATILAAKTIIRWIINHESTMLLNFQVKAWMRWLMRSVVCVPMSCHVVDALRFGPWVGLGGHDGISRGLHPEVLQNDSVEVAKFVWLERDSDNDYLHALYFIYIYIYMSQISRSLLKIIIVKFPTCRTAQKISRSEFISMA